MEKDSGFSGFVLEHENDDTSRLLLSKGKWEGIDIDLAVNTILSRKKLKNKVPAWYSEPALVFPAKLSAEQCSSQDTAVYKAGIAARLLSEAGLPEKKGRIADLTGGLGVDSWAFSGIAGEVLYNETNPALARAAGHNFAALGAVNIHVSCRELVSGSLRDILRIQSGNGTERTEEFAPDIIFLDPARRDSAGKKVFLLEDCRPDVLELKDELLSVSRFLMLKLSPMADISMVTDRLGAVCRELHAVSSGGECKELLAVLDREYDGECRITSVNEAGAPDGMNGRFTFFQSEEKTARAACPASEEEAKNASYLFEPGKSLLKSGAYNLISSRFNTVKISRNTHLYLFNDPGQADVLKYFGKVFRILDVFPMNGRGIRQAASAYPEAEVTARNTHMTSERLRLKLGVRPSDRYHIFGSEYLIITERYDMPEA